MVWESEVLLQLTFTVRIYRENLEVCVQQFIDFQEQTRRQENAFFWETW